MRLSAINHRASAFRGSPSDQPCQKPHLGPGFLERIYQEALCIELQLRGVSFERERPILVHYRGVSIPGQRIDLIVDTCLVVELKAASRFETAHHGQVLSYLRTTGLRLGLLLNFSCPTLKDGIRRIVL
jgi:GxxExxY protein